MPLQFLDDIHKNTELMHVCVCVFGWMRNMIFQSKTNIELITDYF